MCSLSRYHLSLALPQAHLQQGLCSHGRSLALLPSLQVSFLEIYQERLRDLLEDGGAAPQSPQPGTSPAPPVVADSHDQSALQVCVSAPASPSAAGAGSSPAPSPGVPASSPDAGGISPKEPISPRSPKGSTRRQDGAPPASPRTATTPLSPGTPRGLRVREHPTLGPFVAGLTKRTVSWHGLKSAFKEGSARRAVGSTGMNNMSSRSHAIFTITIHKVTPSHGEAGILVHPSVAGLLYLCCSGSQQFQSCFSLLCLEYAARPKGGWNGDHAKLQHQPC